MKWGGAAIAALVIAALSSVVPGRQVLQMAEVGSPASSEKLLVALNTPLVELPDFAIEPQKAIEPTATTKPAQKTF